MMRQYELVERVRAYDPGADEDALNKAYVFTVKWHGSQTRASGDPYFSHPVEVAGLLSDKRLDCASIITGLLHDTVEDTDVTVDMIKETFGGEIAALVDGVTKLSQLELQSDRTKQAENFRKLVLAMSQDIRVLIVKLADRLHNMRTLHFIKSPEKRRRIARETMDIYVPLTERIGIRDWQEELEDIAFQELNPDARASIVARLAFLEESGGDIVDRIKDTLIQELAKHGLTAEISGRRKKPYSIWRKMQRQNIGFEQLSDIMAFRVIVGSVEQCYQALGVLHGLYSMVPGRFKDYISLPKPNGYRSIHTGVIGPENRRIEIQIRTRDMHEIAELGVAAHWRYKEKGGSAKEPGDAEGGSRKGLTEGRQYRWLRELLEILENASGPEDFLEHTKMEMFSDQVFIFTPKGDLHALPRGSCPVDFAYAVHTDIGNRCTAARVNGRLVPLRTELRNGDQVEIITSKAQTPSPAWENFVVTGKARACIRRFIRSVQREQYIRLGKEILDRAFKAEGYDATEKALKGIAQRFDAETGEDVQVAVGEGRVSAREVLIACYPGVKEKEKDKTVPKRKAPGQIDPTAGGAIPIRGLIPHMAIHFARCCHPLPGDRIIGIVTTGKGVTIHNMDCPTLENFSDMPERWLDVSWDAEAVDGTAFTGRVRTVLLNEPGALAEVTAVIGREGGNISNLKFTSRSVDFFEMLIDIEVTTAKQLNNILAALRASRHVNSVERA
ncbi:bifunctional (p)ppGpp synthetase/guanosine-3',5'-bis(diphosphate) 3'-pyrophosphohydrolase [Rhodospirillaceae bacterium KN72]|uniref:GTP pyrophosphokinase rsh n=1 Tax=Pacificispira spongiicola TaxID=2729598 RepID=A0A7Y0HE33_9PROT|nr:bifunctional (p)ppGpp synthetase/guanosine-3',5'-bis(diphosphate) 3'-pyrophosphohydrolase [Pacificispira spongiicola]NMM44451.1 bifunctional (p)ppGpp synthetase/guanosine-3',5'-bis(diphosphate) 3'-pyrophosphohydrolase [Pacificispira spongiicola]